MDEASVMFKRTAIIVTRFQKAAVWVYFCLVFFFRSGSHSQMIEFVVFHKVEN